MGNHGSLPIKLLSSEDVEVVPSCLNKAYRGDPTRFLIQNVVPCFVDISRMINDQRQQDLAVKAWKLYKDVSSSPRVYVTRLRPRVPIDHEFVLVGSWSDRLRWWLHKQLLMWRIII